MRAESSSLADSAVAAEEDSAVADIFPVVFLGAILRKGLARMEMGVKRSLCMAQRAWEE